MSAPFQLGEEVWRVIDDSRYRVKVVKIDSPKSVSVQYEEEDLMEESVDVEELEPRWEHRPDADSSLQQSDDKTVVAFKEMEARCHPLEGRVFRLIPGGKDDSELWKKGIASRGIRPRCSKDTWSLSGKERPPPREPLHFRPLAARCSICSTMTPYRCQTCGEAYYCSYACKSGDKEQHIVACVAHPFKPLFTFPKPSDIGAAALRSVNFGLLQAGPFCGTSSSGGSSGGSSGVSKNPWGSVDGDGNRGVRIEEPVAAMASCVSLWPSEGEEGKEDGPPYCSPPSPPHATPVSTPPRGRFVSGGSDDLDMSDFISHFDDSNDPALGLTCSSPVDLLTDYGAASISRALGETRDKDSWTSNFSSFPPPILIPAPRAFDRPAGAHVDFCTVVSNSSWPPTHTEVGCGTSFGSDKDDDLQRAIEASLAP